MNTTYHELMKMNIKETGCIETTLKQNTNNEQIEYSRNTLGQILERDPNPKSFFFFSTSQKV